MSQEAVQHDLRAFREFHDRTERALCGMEEMQMKEMEEGCTQWYTRLMALPARFEVVEARYRLRCLLEDQGKDDGPIGWYGSLEAAREFLDGLVARGELPEDVGADEDMLMDQAGEYYDDAWGTMVDALPSGEDLDRWQDELEGRGIARERAVRCMENESARAQQA